MLSILSRPCQSEARPLCRAIQHAALLTWIALLCAACARNPPEVEPPEPEIPAESPFALEIKEVVLRHFVSWIEERLGEGYLYLIEDAAHGDELVRLLQGASPLVTNRVVVALEDGAVVAYETRQPVVMCALLFGEWTADTAEVSGVWYASAELEGTEPFRVIWQAPRWLVLGEEEDL